MKSQEKFINILNEIKHTLWDAANIEPSGQFIALNAVIRKEGRSEVSTLKFHLRKPETEEQIKSKVSRMDITLKSQRENNEIENRKSIKSVSPKASSL